MITKNGVENHNLDIRRVVVATRKNNNIQVLEESVYIVLFDGVVVNMIYDNYDAIIKYYTTN